MIFLLEVGQGVTEQFSLFRLLDFGGAIEECQENINGRLWLDTLDWLYEFIQVECFYKFEVFMSFVCTFTPRSMLVYT